MPFAVPFHRRLVVGKGLVEVVQLQPAAAAAEIGGVELAQAVVHVEDRVDRALDRAGDVAGDIGHILEVLAVQRLLDRLRADGDQFAQRHQRRRGGHVGTEGQVEQGLDPGPVVDRQLEDDVDLLLVGRLVEQVERQAVDGDLEGPGDLALGDAVEGRLLLVDGQDLPGPRLFLEPVDVDHPCGLGEDLFDLGRQFQALPFVAAVDLGDQGLQHRRAGRDLGHGHRRPVSGGDGGDRRPHPLGDVVALLLPFALGFEVDLDVGHRRPRAHEVVAHQAVEVVRRGGAGIDLVVDDVRVRC